MLIVLDAMGVMFRTRDDWPGHLSRFVERKGSRRAVERRDEFVETYLACTRGEVSTDELWEWCGLDPARLDAEYVDFYVTTPGLSQFIDHVVAEGHRVACLTNDAATWSQSLRATHGLVTRIDPWVVSSDVGTRKPDAAIFDHLARLVERPLKGAVFVDDTEGNLDAAAQLGMQTIHYRGTSDRHPTANNWTEARTLLAALDL